MDSGQGAVGDLDGETSWTKTHNTSWRGPNETLYIDCNKRHLLEHQTSYTRSLKASMHRL